MNQVNKILSAFVLALFMTGCQERSVVDGIRIDTFKHAMKDYKSNKKICHMVSATLRHDEKALSDLVNTGCGGGADCYELGFILSQIVYKMGEPGFLQMAEKLSVTDKSRLRFWLMCGLEYGDNDAVGGQDNRKIEVEFPQLDSLLGGYLPERIYGSQIKSTYYWIRVNRLDSDFGDELELNAEFIILKKSGESFIEIYKDSIHNEVDELKLADFNGDNQYDILVQNFSDVRSNWTYYLYMIDNTEQQLIKIRGFEEIKNPRYLRNYDLVDNYVNSGRNWTQFHKIQGDTVFTYPYIIYDGIDEEDTSLVATYEQDYKDVLKQILKH